MKKVKYALICLIALVFLGEAALAQTIYGVSHIGRDGLSTFHEINPETGEATAIGPVGYERCGSMDFSADGRLFAICERADGSNIGVVIQINPTTGAGTEIGPIGNCINWTDMSFSRADNTLFATALDFVGPSNCVGGVDNRLAIIDTETGASTLIGRTNQVAGGGNSLAFSPLNILLYLTSGIVPPDDIPFLYSLNQVDGDGTFLSNPIYPDTLETFPRANAMDFEDLTGILFMSIVTGGGNVGVQRENFLGTLDVNTGEVTVIGPTVEGLDGIAVISRGRAVPTLSEWGLIAMATVLGIVGLIVARRRTASAGV